MTTSVVVALVFLLGGCLKVSLTGYSGYDGSSAGSTSAGTTTARGGSGSSSTGGVASSSSSSSGTGTTGSTFDAGMCGGTGTSLETNPLGYVPGPGALSISNSADFNGDGLLDVVVSIGGSGGLSVLLGLPDGGLLSSSHFNPSHSADLGPIVAGDVDGDGRPDLLCGAGNGVNNPDLNTGIEVLLNVDGGLTYPQLLINRTAPVWNFAVGDLDQDGIPDVVDSEATDDGVYTVTAFFGLGVGKFSEGTWIATLSSSDGETPPGTMLLSDLNQDGFPDLVVVPAAGSQIAVLLRQSTGDYTTSLYTFPSQNVIAATLPRSGAAPDLVAAYGGATGSTVQVLSNAGDGTFSMGPTYPVPTLANAILVGDFNGDCLPDVALSAPAFSPNCGPTAGSLYVFFGLEDGGLQTARSLPPHAGGGGNLATLGPVSTPRALVNSVSCGNGDADAGTGDDVYVYGDASQL